MYTQWGRSVKNPHSARGTDKVRFKRVAATRLIFEHVSDHSNCVIEGVKTRDIAPI